jgi:dihydrolipoamide dehydrogenase
VEGVELAGVYAAFGSHVTLAEARNRLLPGVDGDLVRVLGQQIRQRLEDIRLETTVSELHAGPERVDARMEAGSTATKRAFDMVVLAIGRKPRTSGIGLRAAGVETDEDGYILVDERRQTSNPRVYAAGDVIGPNMLAHKAIREGRVAAEVMAGRSSSFDARAIPTVVYTDPPIAWAGITEAEAREKNWQVDVQLFHWRAFPEDVASGMTKLVLAPDSGRVLGMGIVGRGGEALIYEGVLAIEMGALAEDLALSMHPRHNLLETDAELDAFFLGGAEQVFPHEL